MAMDEVRYCDIHTSGSIGVNRIATKLHLGDRTALRFLLAKERAWSVLLGVFLLLILEVSVTDQGRFKKKAGRTGELSVSPPVSPPSDDLGDNANTNGSETYSKLK